jgi:hypothetical protein
VANWTESQRVRLAYEEMLLKQEISHFWFQDRTSAGLTTARGKHTTARNRAYTMCVWMKAGYPDEMPDLYIIEPCPLYGYQNKTVQSYGTSHQMHAWTPDWNDYVKICHTKEDYWSAADTIVSVVLKGFLWLEAFEVHCRTGQSIDAFSLSY